MKPRQLTIDELRAWREQMRYTQEALARRLGTSGQTVRNWENGRRPVPSWLHLALVGIEATEPKVNWA